MVVVHYIEAIIFYTFENEFWMDGSLVRKKDDPIIFLYFSKPDESLFFFFSFFIFSSSLSVMFIDKRERLKRFVSTKSK